LSGLVVVMFVGVGIATSADDSDTSSLNAEDAITDPINTDVQAAPPVVDQVGSDGQPSNPGALYPSRLGIEDNDHEGQLGEAVAYAGWNVHVDDATVTDDVLEVRVRLFNREADARSFSALDWGLQRPGGEIQGVLLRTDASGTVAGGGGVALSLEFNVRGIPSGEVVYLLHEPGLFDDARGVWGLTLP
jgi:hypothetical protein